MTRKNDINRIWGAPALIAFFASAIFIFPLRAGAEDFINAPLNTVNLTGESSSLPYKFKVFYPMRPLYGSYMGERYRYITVNLQSRDMNKGIKRPPMEPALGAGLLDGSLPKGVRLQDSSGSWRY